MILFWIVLILTLIGILIMIGTLVGAIVAWTVRPIDGQTYFELHGKDFTTYRMNVNGEQLEYHLMKTGGNNDYNDRNPR
jgi:uncharacterized Tic20 family protein